MSEVTTAYDLFFQNAAKQWLPEWPWLYFKAQGYQESLLQPDAVSPSGAKGIMQIMDDTWVDIKQRLSWAVLPATATVFDPESNITGGVYYMSVMRSSWAAPRSEDDRRKLAQASFNCGFGNMLQAQKLSGGKSDYDSIIAQLPNVTGVKNAGQTTTYVERIYQWYNLFSSEAEATT